MDYRGNAVTTSTTMLSSGGGYNDYPSGSVSTITSPPVARDVTRSTGQPSPSSVIEELQGKFQSSARAREKKTILKNTDYVNPVYHRRTATSVTATATLGSRPHHQSELTLPTTRAAAFDQSVRSINTATTVRLDPGATLRAGESSAFRGGKTSLFFIQKIL